MWVGKARKIICSNILAKLTWHHSRGSWGKPRRWDQRAAEGRRLGDDDGNLVILVTCHQSDSLTTLSCFLTWGAAKAEATRERITKGVILSQGVQSILRCKEFWYPISQIFRPLIHENFFLLFKFGLCSKNWDAPHIQKSRVIQSIHKNFSERCHLLRNLLVNRNWSKASPWSLYSRAAFSTSCPASLSFDQLSWGGVGLSSGCSTT